MGMTIDEAIEHGKEQLEIFGGEHKEFIVCALDTMQKYQKIEKIIKQQKTIFMMDTLTAQLFLHKIKEVVENGSDD